MSCTSTYALYKTTAACIAEHGNSHGSAPAIWDYISRKLRGKKFDMFNTEEFWPLWKDTRLDNDERAVLLSTYDNAYVSIEHLAEFAAACRKLHGLIISNTEWTWNHFEGIANDAEKLAKKHDYRCIGFAIGCTSVCDIWEQEKIKNIETWEVYQAIQDEFLA